MFQWVIGANRPLRLDEWHHILAFIKDPPPKSLDQWRESDTLTENDEQLEKEIKTLSRGLLEISTTSSPGLQDGASISTSIHAGAGSLDHEQGSARVVQVMHESVREFLLYGNGLAKLGSKEGTSELTNCHFVIASTCMDYIMISELDDFVAARQGRTAQSSTKLLSMTNSSVDIQEIDALQKSPRPECTLERLQTMSISNPAYPIHRWIAEIDSLSMSTHTVNSAKDATRSVPSEVYSQVLQDYPALLLYATSELPSHLKRAGTGFGQFPVKTIVKRLQDKITWNRFAALKEDMRSETSVIGWLERQERSKRGENNSKIARASR